MMMFWIKLKKVNSLNFENYYITYNFNDVEDMGRFIFPENFKIRTKI